MIILGTLPESDGIVELWGDVWVRFCRNAYPAAIMIERDVVNAPRESNGYTTGMSLSPRDRDYLRFLIARSR